MSDGRAPDPARGVYGISVAAELVGMAPQTLRLYEERGLLEPDRTDGGTRRYSQDDLDQLHRIATLLSDGLNLAGVAAVLGLERDNARLRAENRRMRRVRRAARDTAAESGEHPSGSSPVDPC